MVRYRFIVTEGVGERTDLRTAGLADGVLVGDGVIVSGIPLGRTITDSCCLLNPRCSKTILSRCTVEIMTISIKKVNIAVNRLAIYKAYSCFITLSTTCSI